MKIAEIFHSIQGEGTLVGVPSIFVRTSGCNLRCVWCDTPYTSWQPEGKELGIDQILSEVLLCGSRHVVVTGGEPMIAPQIAELTQALRTAKLHITIETAGTVMKAVECDLMSISPKLKNSTPTEREGGRWAAMHERTRYQPDILKELMREYDYQLKFVIAASGDIQEVREMQEELDAPSAKILLMPEGVKRETMLDRGIWLAEVCKQYGYRYSPRLHVDLWGDRRGV